MQFTAHCQQSLLITKILKMLQNGSSNYNSPVLIIRRVVQGAAGNCGNSIIIFWCRDETVKAACFFAGHFFKLFFLIILPFFLSNDPPFTTSSQPLDKVSGNCRNKETPFLGWRNFLFFSMEKGISSKYLHHLTNERLKVRGKKSLGYLMKMGCSICSL